MPNTKSSDIRYKVLDRYLRRGGYSTYELMNEVKIPIQLQYRIMNYCNGWRHKTTFASGWGPKPWNEEWSRSSCCATSQDSKRLRTEELYILERILVTFDPLKAILHGRFNPCPFILDGDAVKKGRGRIQDSFHTHSNHIIRYDSHYFSSSVGSLSASVGYWKQSVYESLWLECHKNHTDLNLTLNQHKINQFPPYIQIRISKSPDYWVNAPKNTWWTWNAAPSTISNCAFCCKLP